MEVACVTLFANLPLLTAIVILKLFKKRREIGYAFCMLKAIHSL